MSHGGLLVKNASGAPVELVSARVERTWGDVTVLGATIADEERVLWVTTGRDGFPPISQPDRYPPGTEHPLEGFVLKPAEEDNDESERFNTIAVFVGVRVGELDVPTGISGICITYRTTTDRPEFREQCEDDIVLAVCSEDVVCPERSEFER